MCGPALARFREGSDVLTPFPSLLISLFFLSLWFHLSNSAAVELSMKPVITARVASHGTSQTLVNWGLGGEDIQLHMPPFVAANYWFEDCNLVSPSPSGMGYIYLTDQKVAALSPFFLLPLQPPQNIIDICTCKFASGGLLLPARWHFGRISPSHWGVEIMVTELTSFFTFGSLLLRWISFFLKTEAGRHQAPITSDIVLRIHSHRGEFHPPLLPRALSPLQIPHSHRCTRIRTHQHTQIDR